MIIINDQWAIRSDNTTQFTVLHRATEAEWSAARDKMRAAGKKVSDDGERTWKPVAYHSRLDAAANALMDRMMLDGGEGARDVAYLVRVVTDARTAIVEAVRGVGVGS